MDAFTGEIRLFAGNFAPVNWSMCSGQELPISQNETLYTLFGTLYGGGGTTFNLPDLRGRVPIHFGQGANMTSHPLASKGGTEDVTLTIPNLPAHSHAWMANSAAAGLATPAGNVLADVGTGNTLYETDATFNNAIAAPANTLGYAGGNQPHENMMPFMALSFIVALQGLFPTQN